MAQRWTLGEIMSRATRAVGERGEISASDASWWANEAYHQVSQQVDHALQEKVAVSSTTSGENRISLPSDFREMLVVSYLTDVGSRRTLRQASAAAKDGEFTRNDLGVPDEFVLYQDWLELWPSPDSSYSLQMRYMSYQTDLTATSDVPSVSTPWRYAIYLKTKELLWGEHLGEPDMANFARNDFLDYITTTPDDQARRRRRNRTMSVNPVYTKPK